jgi:hypothetical protein
VTLRRLPPIRKPGSAGRRPERWTSSWTGVGGKVTVAFTKKVDEALVEQALVEADKQGARHGATGYAVHGTMGRFNRRSPWGDTARAA